MLFKFIYLCYQFYSIYISFKLTFISTSNKIADIFSGYQILIIYFYFLLFIYAISMQSVFT